MFDISRVVMEEDGVNAKLSGNGRTNLINIQSYALYLRRIYYIVCQVLCHCTEFAVKSQ